MVMSGIPPSALLSIPHPDLQIREIPYPEKPIGDPQIRPCSHYDTKIDVRACKKIENLVTLFAPETRKRSYVSFN